MQFVMSIKSCALELSVFVDGKVLIDVSVLLAVMSLCLGCRLVS
jgi:hypothetical protein